MLFDIYGGKKWVVNLYFSILCGLFVTISEGINIFWEKKIAREKNVIQNFKTHPHALTAHLRFERVFNFFFSLSLGQIQKKIISKKKQVNKLETCLVFSDKKMQIR